MQTRPAAFSDELLASVLRTGWAMEPERSEYLPVGFGSHHWRVRAAGGDWFVTVDDLAARLSSAAESLDEAFAELGDALATARVVQDAGLSFVVAPERTNDGAVLERVEQQYAVAVYPWVNGRPRAFGEELSTGARRALMDMLVALHDTPLTRRFTARTDRLQVPSRDELTAAMDELDDPWDTGPYGERARFLLATHNDGVRRLLARYDELVATAADPARLVLTHGEPHAGNLIETDDGLLLVDWDTTRVAPPERDLWMLAESDPSVTAAYEQATGRPVLPDLLTYYRLAWLATDIALFVADFRRPHEETDDMHMSWLALETYLANLPRQSG